MHRGCREQKYPTISKFTDIKIRFSKMIGSLHVEIIILQYAPYLYLRLISRILEVGNCDVKLIRKWR